MELGHCPKFVQGRQAWAQIDRLAVSKPEFDGEEHHWENQAVKLISRRMWRMVQGIETWTNQIQQFRHEGPYVCQRQQTASSLTDAYKELLPSSHPSFCPYLHPSLLYIGKVNSIKASVCIICILLFPLPHSSLWSHAWAEEMCREEASQWTGTMLVRSGPNAAQLCEAGQPKTHQFGDVWYPLGEFRSLKHKFPIQNIQSTVSTSLSGCKDHIRWYSAEVFPKLL